MISLLVGDDATMSEGATSRFVNMLQHLVLLSDDAIAIIGGAALSLMLIAMLLILVMLDADV